MAQDIELSPRKILSYMRDLEDKLPRRKYSEFDSGIIFSINSDNELNIAAKKMMDFVGLNSFVPQCIFGKTDKGIGGYTMAQRSDEIVPICVSEEYKGNKLVTMAILAHEICHKVIYINGINHQGAFQMLNEIFTDICTIYVGFGKLVLEGYKTNKSCLGYLEFHVYKDTYDITQQILLNNTSAKVNSVDPYLTDAFTIWHSDTDKGRLFLNSFADMQAGYSNLTRDFNILSQIIEHIKNSYANTLDKADECYFRKGDYFDKGTRNIIKPIGAFSAIYESILTKDSQSKFQSYDDTIINAIISLVNKYDIEIDQMDYKAFKCPFCHKESSKPEFDNRSLNVTCPSCRKHFHLNCEHLNVSKELGRLRRQEKEDHNLVISEGIEEGQKIGYGKGFEKGKIEGDKIGFKKGLEMGRNEGRKQGKADFISSLPAFLRWLVKFYDE